MSIETYDITTNFLTNPEDVLTRSGDVVDHPKSLEI